MLHPFYKNRPIGSVKALAKCLGVTETLLRKLAADTTPFYRVAHEIEKSDGSTRVVFSVRDPLKAIQKKIKKKLLDKVYYPAYIQGGIKDTDNPRDYVKNAGIHAGSVVLINEDISGFFPSVTRKTIFNIWMCFFNFPREIAEILTDLTIKDNGLAQGASTSCHLANLVFWKTEPRLVDLLQAEGMKFSRYVDDISVSSASALSAAQKGRVISLIRKMASQNKLKLKSRKHRIYSSREKMLVNNLVINKRVSLPTVERSRIRAAVRSCEVLAKEDVRSAAYRGLINSTKGRVIHMHRFHPKEAERLRNRLTKLPGYSVKE